MLSYSRAVTPATALSRPALAKAQSILPRRTNFEARTVVSSAVANPSTSPDIADTAYPALKAAKGVFLVSAQAEVTVTDLWGENETCVVALGRSMGALARQLQSEVRPELDAAEVKLYLVSIGKKERGLEFVEKTGFDAQRLLADPHSQIYEALGMKKGLKETFASIETPRAIWEDIKTGRIDNLKAVLGEWRKTGLWHPPQPDQALQQGGVVIFKGQKAVWVWRDPATGAHADMNEVIRQATQ